MLIPMHAPAFHPRITFFPCTIKVLSSPGSALRCNSSSAQSCTAKDCRARRQLGPGGAKAHWGETVSDGKRFGESLKYMARWKILRHHFHPLHLRSAHGAEWSITWTLAKWPKSENHGKMPCHGPRILCWEGPCLQHCLGVLRSFWPMRKWGCPWPCWRLWLTTSQILHRLSKFLVAVLDDLTGSVCFDALTSRPPLYESYTYDMHMYIYIYIYISLSLSCSLSLSISLSLSLSLCSLSL